MKTVRLTIEVPVSNSMTVSEVKNQIVRSLPSVQTLVEFEKETLPDVGTKRQGFILWQGLKVKQTRGHAPK